MTTEFYAYINGMDELKFEGREDLGSYLLTDSQIIVPQQKELNILYKSPKTAKIPYTYRRRVIGMASKESKISLLNII